MALLGAFSRMTDVIGIRALTEAIRESLPSNSEPNEMAAIEAYEAVKF
jgi:Pyruvate/2-oxoacid:ferredoxin oxidoreductase gamma subunit